MSDLGKQERAAIEAVARRTSATWAQGRGPTDAYLTVAGKRVAVDARRLERRRSGVGQLARPGLRFDKVATRVLDRLRATIGQFGPDSAIVLLSLTAPIRLASKTTVALQARIRALLVRNAPGRDMKDTIHGNRVRIRLVKNEAVGAPGMIGFVHNPDTDQRLLMDMAREWLELVSSEARRRAPRPAGDRWLVALSARGPSCLDAYRAIHSQLHAARHFKKVFVVFDDGRAELLDESTAPARRPRSSR